MDTETVSSQSCFPRDLVRRTAAFWDAHPCDGYPHIVDRMRFRYHKEPWLPQLLHKIVETTKNGSMLELGCGQGTDAIYVCQRLGRDARYTGIDCSPASIESARRASDELSNLRVEPQFLIGDVESLQFDDSMFDVLYSMGVLHHTPSIETALSEAHRVLKPGRPAFVIVYRSGSLKLTTANVVRKIARTVKRPTDHSAARRYSRWLGTMVRECVDVPILRCYRRKQITTMFRLSGFDVLNIQPAGLSLPNIGVNRILEHLARDLNIGSYWCVEARKKP
ncbi:MAG: hypothetical protein CMJ18_24075 [Phycisphaeraceae bacterium]|nr:hypothetical protein [Phycisphaeraceae bacterium]